MEQFLVTGLNGLALAGLYFLVASGFSLIFGTMRVVNMAHGSLFLLGGYFGWSVADRTGSWLLGVAVGALSMAVLGVILQQILLRRIQGQDLREALATIACSIIIADLLIASYGGLTYEFTLPDPVAGSITIPVVSVVYPVYPLVLIGVALAVGLLLWFLIDRTYAGIVLRAGIDDRAMVSALGINVQVFLALTFALGAALAGAAGVLGGSMLSLEPGVDAQYLVASLVVVIIGGMGSLTGAALGALLVGLVTEYGLGYVPSYAEVITFGLMALVLAARPQGLFGAAA